MKLRIGIGQINIQAGSPEKNVETILQAIREAKKDKCDVVVFPEMAVPGYMIGDLWEDEAFVKDCTQKDEIIKNASDGIIVVWGNVYTENRKSIFNRERTAFGNDGRIRKYNAARIAQNGNYLEFAGLLPKFKGEDIIPESGLIIKTNEPLYREFEDQRHFVPLKELAQQTGSDLKQLIRPFEATVEGQKVKLGVLICEDIWTGDYVYNGEILNPAEIVAQNGAQALLVVSTSPYGWRKQNAREKAIYTVQNKLNEIGKPMPLVYVNAQGVQNNSKNQFGLDGRSSIYDKNSQKIYQAPGWKSGVFTSEIEIESNLTKAASFIEYKPAKISAFDEREEMLEALIQILREFMTQSGLENIVIGMSGGIDSALVAYISVQAVGANHVFGVNIPTKYNSDWTKSTAKYVCDMLDIAYTTVSIEDLVDKVRVKLADVNFAGNYGEYSPNFKKRIIDENLQARIRIADVLSGITAKYPKTIYTNNGNKSEVLLGYFTIDGDGRGAISPIGDLYKTEIAAICAHINEKYALETNSPNKPIIPWELIAPIFEADRYYEDWDGKKSPIPQNTRVLMPSAELSEDQNVDEGKGDPIIYPYHDLLLKKFVEYRQNPENIVEAYNEGKWEKLAEYLGVNEKWLKTKITEKFATPTEWINDIEKIWKLFHSSIFKQIQAPPVVSVSKRSLGFDFRRAVTAAHFTKRYTELKTELLKSGF